MWITKTNASKSRIIQSIEIVRTNLRTLHAEGAQLVKRRPDSLRHVIADRIISGAAPARGRFAVQHAGTCTARKLKRPKQASASVAALELTLIILHRPRLLLTLLLDLKLLTRRVLPCTCRAMLHIKGAGRQLCCCRLSKMSKVSRVESKPGGWTGQ